ncbi:MAG: ABC transporter substrate-binding protein [Ruthenibacterium sp.]
MKKLLALVLALTLALSLVGCGGAASSITADSAVAASTVTDASTATNAGPYKIGFSNYFVGNSWKQQMEAEFKQEAEKLKADGVISEYVMLNADSDQSKQISDIQDLITMGCDAIVVTCITEDGLNDVLQEAMDEGIVVAAFDNLCSVDTNVKITVSDYEFGRSSGEWLAKNVADGSKVIVLDGTAGTACDTNRHNGMVEGFTAGSPKSEIIATANCAWDYATAKSSVEDLLAAYPQIDGVLSQGGAMTQAAIDAFNEAGRKLVPMTGEGGNGFLRVWSENKDKGFKSCAFVCPCSQGAVALTDAIAVLKGEGKGGEHALDTPVITEDNIAEYYRADLNDNYWVSSTLTDDTLKELFGK